MKYISLIIVCTLLLGASGDSERPARWQDAKSEFSKGDFDLLRGVLKIFLQHEERYGISSEEIPEELINLKKAQEESGKILDALTKISENPEALKRFRNVIAHLGDPQSSEGKLFWSIVHDVAINSDDRQMFTEAIKFTSLCELKGRGHHACVLLEWEYPPFLPFWTTNFGKRLHAFNDTSLGDDLDWLGTNLSPERNKLKQDYKSISNSCTMGSFGYVPFWGFRGECSNKYAQMVEELNAEAVPDVLKNWNKYKTEIGTFLKLEERLPEMINLLARYMQFLVGYSAPKNAFELQPNEVSALVKTAIHFLQDNENGMPAVLRHAQQE